MRACCASLLLLIAPAAPAAEGLPGRSNPAAAAPVRWKAPVPLDAAEEDGKPVGNVSGIACIAARAGPRQCLVIDDELSFAQRAVLGARRIRAGARVEIVGANAAVGTAPDLACDDPKKPRDLDGEGVAEASGVFYVIGSHGCGRSKGAFRSSSFLVARIPSPSYAARTSYRVSEALRGCPVVGGYFGRRIEATKAIPAKGDEPAVPARPDGNGLNVEGLAVSGGRMWVGLRGPVIGGTAFIVSMNADAVFAPSAPLDAKVHRLTLGPGHGIRDLARLADGRLLVLSGPRTNAGKGYAIRVYDPRSGATRMIRAIARAEMTGKPEGLLVLHEAAGRADVLLLQDGPANGDPQEFAVRIPAASPAARGAIVRDCVTPG